MKLHKIVLLTLAVVALLTCAMPLSAQENETYVTHTVVRGQTLYGISAMYGVAQADIVALNPGADKGIRAGQTLRIPISQRIDTQKVTYHTIVRGETLYGLCRTYKVSAEELCRANPGLSAKNFRAGQVVRIPAQTAAAEQEEKKAETEALPAPDECRTTHVVKKRETIYSICRQYGINNAQLVAANPQLKNGTLKRGDKLCIPYARTADTARPTAEPATPTDEQLWNQARPDGGQIATLKVAVMLPLLPQDAQAGQSARMVEYYEGMLLAVDSLKRQGVSMDIHTYSLASGETALQGVISRAEMQDMDVIFGPMDAAQIAPLAAHAQRTGARLVVPFTSRDQTVFSNPAIYQINTPQSYLYTEVYDHFLRQFPTEKIVFVEADDEADTKADFINGLKAELQAAGRGFVTVDDDMDYEQIAFVADTLGQNLFIPTSGSHLTLIKVLPQITLLVRNKHDMGIKLFGYPEWQTYTADYIETFFELDTYFYSSFYTNDLLPAARQFTRSYRHWYGKDMEDRFPRYGMLGFDTAYFFLKGLARFGNDLEQHLDGVDVTAIQTGFKFQRVNNWGGFINRKVFFVHFGNDFVLTKIDFDKR